MKEYKWYVKAIVAVVVLTLFAGMMYLGVASSTSKGVDEGAVRRPKSELCGVDDGAVRR